LCGHKQSAVRRHGSGDVLEVPDDKGVVYLYRLGRAVAAANVSVVKVNSIEVVGTGTSTFFR
jgi:hypothetical protein